MTTILKFKALLIFAICLTISLEANNHSQVSEAFVESYKQETLGDYTKAINAIKEVYTEESYEINIRLGWLHYLAGLFTESTTYYQKSIDLMPYSIEAKFGYVLPASALGNWEQVTKQYDDILTIDAQNTKANYRLGLIYYGKEDFQKAHDYLEKVVNLFPFDYDGLIMYAWANLQLGKTREAKILFQKVLLLSPSDSSASEGLEKIQ